MMLFIYNILFPIGFVLFLPGLIYKLIMRPGWKKTFWERFSIFSSEAKTKLKETEGAIWIHSVSVGETMIALSLIKKWQSEKPERKFVLSTTTTTGQELARSKVPTGVNVIFCPIDFSVFVSRTFNVVKPSMLVIFETEIWPNMINQAVKRCGGKLALVNARMSDKSAHGYAKISFFIKPLLENFKIICVQSENDNGRFSTLAPDADVRTCGNMKFDQNVPADLKGPDLDEYFGTEKRTVVLAASTHPGEEKLIAQTFIDLKKDFSDLRLVIMPRHAERGGEIASDLKSLKIPFIRKTSGEKASAPVDCLLADTTGEMLAFMKASDIVIMGKSLAGQDEGHNVIEPALLAKPIVTGAVLKNFRFALNVLKEKDAVITVASDSGLEPALKRLIDDPSFRDELGQRAREAVSVHAGATLKTIKLLEEILCSR